MSDAPSPPVPPAGRGTGLAQAMALLEQAADVLAGVEDADLTDGELTEAMVALDVFRCRFDVAHTVLAGRGTPVASGRSTAAGRAQAGWPRY